MRPFFSFEDGAWHALSAAQKAQIRELAKAYQTVLHSVASSPLILENIDAKLTQLHRNLVVFAYFTPELVLHSHVSPSSTTSVNQIYLDEVSFILAHLVWDLHRLKQKEFVDKTHYKRAASLAMILLVEIYLVAARIEEPQPTLALQQTAQYLNYSSGYLGTLLLATWGDIESIKLAAASATWLSSALAALNLKRALTLRKPIAVFPWIRDDYFKEETSYITAQALKLIAVYINQLADNEHVRPEVQSSDQPSAILEFLLKAIVPCTPSLTQLPAYEACHILLNEM